jgi:hypothetical protein
VLDVLDVLCRGLLRTYDSLLWRISKPCNQLLLQSILAAKSVVYLAIRRSQTGQGTSRDFSFNTSITSPFERIAICGQVSSAPSQLQKERQAILSCGKEQTGRRSKVSATTDAIPFNRSLLVTYRPILTIRSWLSLPALTRDIPTGPPSLPANQFNPSLPRVNAQAKGARALAADSPHHVVSASDSQWPTQLFPQRLTGQPFPPSVQIHRATK